MNSRKSSRGVCRAIAGSSFQERSFGMMSLPIGIATEPENNKTTISMYSAIQSCTVNGTSRVGVVERLGPVRGGRRQRQDHAADRREPNGVRRDPGQGLARAVRRKRPGAKQA